MSRYYNNRTNRKNRCENYFSEDNYLEKDCCGNNYFEDNFKDNFEDNFEANYYDRNRSNRCTDESSSRRDRGSMNDYSSTSEENNRSDNKNSNKNTCKSDNKDDKNNTNEDRKPPKPPKPPYHTIDHIRLINSSDGQQNIGDEASLLFTDIVINSSDFINFAPNTGNILLKDNGVYFVIYESQIYSTYPQDKIHTLGLHLTLDGVHIEGSGTSVRVGEYQKAELSSHAIITTTKGSPNVLNLLNSSNKVVNAFGANLTIIKLAEIKSEKKDDSKDDSKDEKKDHK